MFAIYISAYINLVQDLPWSDLARHVDYLKEIGNFYYLTIAPNKTNSDLITTFNNQ